MCIRDSLGSDLDMAKLGAIHREIGLNEAIGVATQLFNGEIRGRVVVDVNLSLIHI